MVEDERIQGANIHWFHRLKIWDFLDFFKMKYYKYLCPDCEFTFKRAHLIGMYMWNGPLYLDEGTCDIELNRQTINKEIMMIREWSDNCPVRPNLSWQGLFCYRPNYIPCGENMWRYLDTTWRGGQMHGFNITQIDLVRRLEVSLDRNPTPNELLSKSIDRILLTFV